MINGAHIIIYSQDADADRKFFRDVLNFHSVDAGHGWLIFALPPAELAVHPVEGPAPAKASNRRKNQAPPRTVPYLMCSDLADDLKRLKRRKVKCGPVTQASWGLSSVFHLPSGMEIGLYQPMHPTAHKLRSK